MYTWICEKQIFLFNSGGTLGLENDTIIVNFIKDIFYPEKRLVKLGKENKWK